MILFILLLGLITSQIWALPDVLRRPQEPLPTEASPSPNEASVQLSQLAEFALSVATEHIGESHPPQQQDQCTKHNLRIRRNWRAFSSRQKKDFISSVLCLQRLPARTPADLAPGAKTRYDDFVATHINQTLEIHYTGTFLAWHRYFIYEFEQALGHECGYNGDYPYWDWPVDTSSLENSPVFDGTDTSLSGNGAYIPNKPDIQLTLATYDPIILPAGTGGGCVTSGPFKNYTVNLGPAALALPGGNLSTTPNPLNYNPRCLKRDLTTPLLAKYNNYTALVDLLLTSRDITSFQMSMEGVPGSGAIGVHGGGHYSMGGDPGRDVYVSPWDPAFWLHHGMIDRVWWIWQNLEWEGRADAVAGTGTFLDVPPSPETTLETVVGVGEAGGRLVKMGELMSTVGGGFVMFMCDSIGGAYVGEGEGHGIRV